MVDDSTGENREARSFRTESFTVTPISVAKALRDLGTHLETWRKLQRLPVVTVAERAGISRDTLRSIEQGRGGASVENVMRVMRVLGVMDSVIQAADPYTTDVGKLRVDEILPKRIKKVEPVVNKSQSQDSIEGTSELAAGQTRLVDSNYHQRK